MRAVILADFATPSGGAPKVALESARALADAGVDVTYIHAIGNEPHALIDHPRIDRVGLGLHDVWDMAAAKAAAAGIWHREAARRLARALGDVPPGRTVLHLHQWTRSFSPSVFPVLLRSGHPLAVTMHDYFLACPNGVYYRFDQGEPCRLTPLSAGCLAAPCDPKSSLHKAVRVLRTFATRAAVRGGAFDVIHVSDRGRATIAPFLPAGVRQHRVDNPVQTAKAAPARIAQGAKVAYVGRLTREKGADLVAFAAREAGTPVMFIGEGPLEAELRALNPDAEIIGWRPPAEVDRLLRDWARAVAAPSRWYETGPLTVYEAMAAGLPAIASVRSGAAERVASGETGLVVDPTVPALAQAFATLGDLDVARRMGAAAYKRYWDAPPTGEAHAARLIGVYESMLMAGRAPAGLLAAGAALDGAGAPSRSTAA
jgi:glycosyltransferase involved in cell wall biosynthesis